MIDKLTQHPIELLSEAAREGNFPLVKQLVEQGVDVHDDFFGLPSGWAKLYGHTEIFDYLMAVMALTK